ncbi:MAG: hypothetical protein C0519_15830 [Hyphomicrobium sp.]|nr:hypothetical protein [Hyphomicrobium sp.]PPD05921.1 MAG: hypothetical protein CTY28_15610 [Hyphomicrobium sp.]
MLDELKKNFPPVVAGAPADYHPLSLYTKDVRDDLPTRSGAQALGALYSTWATLAETERQVTDKSKLNDFVLNEMTKALAASEKTLNYVKSMEAENSKAIRNDIVKLRSHHAEEIRAVYRAQKVPLSTLLQDARSNPEIAGALAYVPSVLLGITRQEADRLNDAIEAAHAVSSYQTRASARKVATKIEAAREQFAREYFGKTTKWAQSDDVVIAAAKRKRTAA